MLRILFVVLATMAPIVAYVRDRQYRASVAYQKRERHVSRRFDCGQRPSGCAGAARWMGIIMYTRVART